LYLLQKKQKQQTKDCIFNNKSISLKGSYKRNLACTSYLIVFIIFDTETLKQTSAFCSSASVAKAKAISQTKDAELSKISVKPDIYQGLGLKVGI
jgi:hypothetical protein